MIAFGVSIDDRKFREAMGKFQGELNKACVLSVKRYMAHFQARMSKERLRPPVLHRRTGNLARSQKIVVAGKTVDDVIGVYAIGGGLVNYAGIHEHGGTITAKRGKFLAIPLDKTKAGVARRVSPRDYPNTFIAKHIIFQRLKKATTKTGKFKRNKKALDPQKYGAFGITAANNEDIIPLFVLKKSVYIPPRLGVGETWRTDEKYRLDFFRAVFEEAFKRAGLK